MNMANPGSNNTAPDSAFAFEPFKIRTVASSGKDGPVKDKNGQYVSAQAYFGFYALAATPVLVDASRFCRYASGSNPRLLRFTRHHQQKLAIRHQH